MAPSDLIALLDRHERTLIRYACSIVGDLDSARDVVQETFIKLARGEMRNAECRMRNRDRLFTADSAECADAGDAGQAEVVLGTAHSVLGAEHLEPIRKVCL